MKTSKGCYKKYDREAMMAVLTACTSNLGNLTNKNSIGEAIGMRKKIIQASKTTNLRMKITVTKKECERKIYYKSEEAVCS